MATLTLHFELWEHGTLYATAADGESCVSMFVSNLSNALGDLAWEAVALLRGAEQARCPWADEPGEYRWLLVRHADKLDVTILQFGDTFSNRPDAEGELFFHAECELIRFATQLKGQLQQMLNEFGEQGYRERWQRYDFPTRKFEELKQLIAEHKAERRDR